MKVFFVRIGMGFLLLLCFLLGQYWLERNYLLRMWQPVKEAMSVQGTGTHNPSSSDKISEWSKSIFNEPRLKTKDDVFALLDDYTVTYTWPSLIGLIARLDLNKAEAINRLSEFLSRREPYLDANMFGAKICSLQSIGVIGGPEADVLLRYALTEEGAVALSSEWIRIPIRKMEGADVSWKVASVRAKAAIGLAKTHKEENILFVRTLHAMLKQEMQSPSHQDIPNQDQALEDLSTVSALALYDLVEDIGISEYDKMSREDVADKISPYIAKYRLSPTSLP